MSYGRSGSHFPSPETPFPTPSPHSSLVGENPGVWTAHPHSSREKGEEFQPPGDPDTGTGTERGEGTVDEGWPGPLEPLGQQRSSGVGSERTPPGLPQPPASSSGLLGTGGCCHGPAGGICGPLSPLYLFQVAQWNLAQNTKRVPREVLFKAFKHFLKQQT